MSEYQLTHKDAEDNPERYQILSNGAIYDHEIKRIAGCPNAGTTGIKTQAQARELSNIRWEKRRKAWVDGMTEAKEGYTSEYDAVKDAAINITLMATDKQNRHTVNAVDKMMRYAELAPDIRSGKNGDTNIQLNVTGNDAVRELLGVLRDSREEE